MSMARSARTFRGWWVCIVFWHFRQWHFVVSGRSCDFGLLLVHFSLCSSCAPPFARTGTVLLSNVTCKVAKYVTIMKRNAEAWLKYLFYPLCHQLEVVPYCRLSVTVLRAELHQSHDYCESCQSICLSVFIVSKLQFLFIFLFWLTQ